MTVDFTRKHLITTVIIVLLIVAGIAATYFLLVKDEKESLERKMSELDNLAEQLSIIEKKIAATSDHLVLSSTELQRRLPVKPLIDQLMLDIDRAEFISKSRVSQLSIGSTDEEYPFPQETPAEREKRDSSAKVEEKYSLEDDEAEEEEESIDDEEFSSDEYLPRGLKMVRISISAVADSYFEMEKFIDSLQSLPRIIRLDSLSFSGQTEVTTLAESEEQDIPFSLNLTAFYFPTLTDLIDELPTLDPPQPANKVIPFFNFSNSDLEEIKRKRAERAVEDADANDDFDEDNDFIDDNHFDENLNDDNENNKLPEQDLNDEKKNDQISEAPAQNKIHKVVYGDTLYGISIKYYGNPFGAEKIKEANEIKSHIIIPGQQLTIPN